MIDLYLFLKIEKIKKKVFFNLILCISILYEYIIFKICLNVIEKGFLKDIGFF